jgi:hypothetical protein
MLHSIFAILAGFFVIVVGVLGTTPLVARLLGQEMSPTPAPAYLMSNLVAGFFCAVIGGWVAARLAPGGPAIHGDVLAGLVLILGVATAAQGGAARSGQPRWYVWLLPFIGAAGVVLGGLLGR